jgi:hypothetical protein
LVLLRHYGWMHRLAGFTYQQREKSLRSTTSATGYTDGGFTTVVDRHECKVKFAFNAAMVNKDKHGD